MLCRLCFYECNEGRTVALFSDDEESNLTKLIAKYLYIEVTQHDVHSTIVCSDCSQHLYDFHKYFQYVEQRQNVFQKSLQEKKVFNDENKLQETEVMVKSMQNLSESLLDMKEFISEGSNDRVEFAYASDCIVEDAGFSSLIQDDDEDDEPLQNLLPIIRRSKRKQIRRTLKAKVALGKRKKNHGKSFSTKKAKNLLEDSNENSSDPDKSLSQSKNIFTAEEDKQRDDLIAKHIQLKCEMCDSLMESYKDLRTHFRIEHKSKPYITCCGKRFKQRFLLIDHINSHLDPDYFKCKICGKVFKSRICISVHMGNMHSDRDQQRHCCELCGKRFSHQSILKTHMLVHTEERNHICEICNKKFKSIHMLKAHTQHMHGEKTPYVCDTCGKEYRFKLSFERHVAEHQGILSDQQQQCPTCSKWFSSNYIKRHIKRHELMDVDCQKCGKTLKSKAALSSHMEYSHRTKRVYSCTFCDRTFERALNLKEHIDMHTGQKCYNCAHCKREFRSKANMYAHVKKMHFEQWTQAQLIRNRGPVG